MALQLGVCVDRQLVTMSTSFSRERIEILCQTLLSIRPQDGDIEKSSIRLTWLLDKFNEDVLNNLAPDVDDKVL